MSADWASASAVMRLFTAARSTALNEPSSPTPAALLKLVTLSLVAISVLLGTQS